MHGAAGEYNRHQKRRRKDDGQLCYDQYIGQIAEIVGHRNAETHEELDQQNGNAAEHGRGHAGRGHAVASKVVQPKPHAQPFALAEEHRFLVELIDGPTDGKQATGQCDGDNR